MKEQKEIKVERVAATEQGGGVFQTGARACRRWLLRVAMAACGKWLPATKNTTTIHDPASRRKLYARRALVYAVCLIVYILLDRSAMFLQMWPNISAWYPPVGFAVVLIIGFGPEVLPLLTFSSYLSGSFRNHELSRGICRCRFPTDHAASSYRVWDCEPLSAAALQ